MRSKETEQLIIMKWAIIGIFLCQFTQAFILNSGCSYMELFGNDVEILKGGLDD